MREWIQTKIEEVFAIRQITAIEKIFSVLKGLFCVGSFKKFIASIVIIAECLGCILLDTSITPYGDNLDLTDYTLVMEDEFNGNQLNTDVWQYRGNGPRRGGYMWEGQNRVENGNLVITAEYKDDVYGEGWYAGMIRTYEEYKYGYYEVRCKVGGGGGIWSAFWLNSTGMVSAEASNGGKGGAEIDIFESSSNPKDCSVYSTIHVGGYGDGLVSRIVGKYKVKDAFNDYNTYGCLWTPDEYIFYINGVESGRIAEGVSQFEEYPIISLCLPKEVSEDTDFTVEYFVDYMRIYQLAP